ncbi:hypothetical protein TWF132_001681 [Orbilia oligospora]|nr:hypothetical protein TWF132_001681 [Orbilia oligospora]
MRKRIAFFNAGSLLSYTTTEIMAWLILREQKVPIGRQPQLQLQLTPKIKSRCMVAPKTYNLELQYNVRPFKSHTVNNWTVDINTDRMEKWGIRSDINIYGMITATKI